MWTKEQKEAIDREGTNIIVSAGAGSGKTAVLTERVLRKVKHGTHINELLIMTFTNAAAKEMKDRIRKKLKKENFIDEVNLIDSSYITTFDSFSLSIVKKYHYILNLSKNISIADQALLNIEKNKIIDEIFDNLYKESNSNFSNLINNFCYKEDDSLKSLLLKLDNKLDMKINKVEYLNSYINNFYNEEKIENDIYTYYLEIKSIFNEIEKEISNLSLYVDGTYIEKVYDSISSLLSSKSYDEVILHIDSSLPRLPKNCGDDVKLLKDKINSMLDAVKDLCIYDNEVAIKNEILSTKDNILMIIDILIEFDKKLNKIKYDNNLFSFSDISRMAIKIVEENEEIREELRNNFKEIMVDEYQDTNDIQEYFVQLISSNNVYMVGDIKQSIYRFRNANPYIFKDKYDDYSKNNNGIKIDLLKNFRSRMEVLDNINLLFDKMMDDDLGGADYVKSHRMVFGNNSYIEEGNTDQEYNFEVLEYEESDKFTKLEKEIFIIGNDIKDKINNKYQVFDKDNKILRDINYNDFVILLDRTADFDLYKKLFEYLSIPLTLYKDEDISNDNDILVIRNILKLQRSIDMELYDNEFKYSFLSVGRSNLFNYSDQELFEIFSKNSFMDSDIFKKSIDLYNYYYELSPKAFFLKLLEIFNYEQNLLKLNNINVSRIRMEYFYNLLENIEKSGMTIDDFIDYLDVILDSDEKTRFSLNTSNSNSVKIMTIHKSKGLEFPICYFAGFYKNFSFQELNDPILFSNNYGIIIPYFNEYKKDTIYKTLLKKETKREEVSEKIRLLYVALTRAKEKMIIIIPKIDEEKLNTNISYYDRCNIKSFYELLKTVYFDLDNYKRVVDVICTKDYLVNNSLNNYNDLANNISINISDINIENEEIKEEKFSKSNIKLIANDEKSKMDFGTRVHEILEFIDFKNPSYDLVPNNILEYIKAFIESDIIKGNINSKFYKEYEFIYNNDDILKHGIIDLMIENEDKIIIIDYKLKNVDDIAYKKQLNGYRDAIKIKSEKDVDLYLYSIIDKSFTKIK